jgi:toxin ParE1/3/4
VTVRFRVHPLVEEDIADVLAYTLDRFGLGQYHRYERIIEEALTRLVEHPEIGRALKSRAGFYLYSIGGYGRRASHQFLYRVLEGGRVEVLRLLHDSMDASRHIPRDLGDD